MSLIGVVRDLQLPRQASESDMEAACDEIRDRLVLQALNEFLPRQKNYIDFELRVRDFQVALWTEGFPSLEDRARAAIQKRVAFMGEEFVEPSNAGKKAVALMPVSDQKAEPAAGNVTTESGDRRKRGRPQIHANDKKMAAAELKASGGTNRQVAAIIYGTNRPTAQQTKNVTSILRHYRNSKCSTKVGQPLKASPKPNNRKG